MELTAACLQLNAGGDEAANIEAALTQALRAKKAGAQLIALPENAFFMDTTSGATRPVHALDVHPGVRSFADFARTEGVWVFIGSVAVPSDREGKFYNRQVVLNPEGNVAGWYDKIHLFDAELPNGEHYRESDRFDPGSEAKIMETPWGKIGLTICYDLRFPGLFRKLAVEGAGLIVVPAAFTYTTGLAHWHVLLRARAIETGCFILAAAQTGAHPGGRRTYGHALIVSPWGEIVADAGEEPGYALATLDLGQIATARAALPVLQHYVGF